MEKAIAEMCEKCIMAMPWMTKGDTVDERIAACNATECPLHKVRMEAMQK